MRWFHQEYTIEIIKKNGRDLFLVSFSFFVFFFLEKKRGHVSLCTKSSSATVPGHPPFKIIVIADQQNVELLLPNLLFF